MYTLVSMQMQKCIYQKRESWFNVESGSKHETKLCSWALLLTRWCIACILHHQDSFLLKHFIINDKHTLKHCACFVFTSPQIRTQYCCRNHLKKNSSAWRVLFGFSLWQPLHTMFASSLLGVLAGSPAGKHFQRGAGSEKAVCGFCQDFFLA